MKNPTRQFKRAEIWIADLGEHEGSEQRGLRPVLIIQNDVGNFYSPTIIVASITDGRKRYMPTHVMLPPEVKMKKDSTVLLEQIRTVDKRKMYKRIAVLSDEVMAAVEEKLKISVGLIPVPIPGEGGEREK